MQIKPLYEVLFYDMFFRVEFIRIWRKPHCQIFGNLYDAPSAGFRHLVVHHNLAIVRLYIIPCKAFDFPAP